MQLPAWADIAKTGAFKELAPIDPDWYYVRAAAVARKIYINQGLGVGAMRKMFGGRAARGAAPEHFAKAAGAFCARHGINQGAWCCIGTI